MSSLTPTRTEPERDPHSLVVGGLPIHIYGLAQLSPASNPRPIAVLFLLHGRLSSAAHPLIPRFAHTLLDPPSPSTSPQERNKDLLVVTFDQRNHGHRLVSPNQNLGWVEGGKKRQKEREELGLSEGQLDNPSHAVDMVAMQTGTSRDVSFLIDFLPSALFPSSSHEITSWFVAGVSLGGHATWLALAQDPRLTLGIPIIASPSILSLLTHRALTLPPPSGPLSVPSSFFPASLVSLLERIDPDRQSMGQGGVWEGKNVLVLSGGEDPLVGWKEGGSEAFVARLEKEGQVGTLEVWVQDKTGHACTPEMMHRARDFVWKYGLGVGSGTARGSGNDNRSGSGLVEGEEGKVEGGKL
ncbi:hypothetical protein JCM11251_007961 [Rhodosporidiobolus azoricus]